MLAPQGATKLIIANRACLFEQCCLKKIDEVSSSNVKLSLEMKIYLHIKTKGLERK